MGSKPEPIIRQSAIDLVNEAKVLSRQFQEVLDRIEREILNPVLAQRAEEEPDDGGR